MLSLVAFTALACVLTVGLASPTQTTQAKRATCTVNSVASAADLSDCTSVVITAFSVPSGETVTIKAASGASITMTGSVTFSKTTASGPLWTFDTSNANFNGNGFSFKGNGDLYWDGEGTSGGVTKPHPFIKFEGYGSFTDFIIKNSPAHAISVGKNTDGFDVSASDLTISGCKVYNQDDCIAINSGSNIVFENNFCSGGHGISIGSIATGKTVSGVTISGNQVEESMYGMRIKVDNDATSASVSDVTYSGNTISTNDKYGFLITQSYSADFGTPGTGSTISDINFTGSQTKITVSGNYPRVGVDCGHCSGTWNWAELVASGGESSDIVLGGAKISGGSY
ncbi:polygalacturonase [Lentinula edodes]|uniref:polygalacturonase n=1 Tax=Lentinula edodes TaxID=5353 RepID=UPI001E8CC227|nr:polygalacturonase [Lentinula edodes]KAH7878412.1 polygalacturonase [Lentinula edodes]